MTSFKKFTSQDKKKLTNAEFRHRCVMDTSLFTQQDERKQLQDTDHHRGTPTKRIHPRSQQYKS